MNCELIKKNGKGCGAKALTGSTFCYFHNPDVSEAEKKKAQTSGGTNRALTIKTPLPAMILTTPEDTVLLMADTISRVRAGTLDIRTANCLGFLADKLLKALEYSYMAERVDELLEKIESGELKT